MSEVSDITTLQVPNYAKWMREQTDPERVCRPLLCVVWHFLSSSEIAGE